MSGFHLILYAGARPAMHGWWRSEVTARDKLTRWVGRGGDGVRVVLVDEASGETIDEWPQQR